jgi:nucleotidyltransferase/DNA polymerase involved in DNA repair
MAPSTKRAIIHITTSGKSFSQVNYSRRIYAIIRRYTPDVVEGTKNECFADLTGLRTFFKMTYKELAENILNDVRTEIGVSCTVRVSTAHAFEQAKILSKKPKTFSTYKEINKLFTGLSFVAVKNRKSMRLPRRKLVVPFIGKVA